MHRLRLKHLPLLPTLLVPLTLLGQTTPVQNFGARNWLLQPAGDSTLKNIIVGSAVTAEGKLQNSRDVFLVQPSTGTVRRLTTFSNDPGATAVSITPDGTGAAYLGLFNRAGNQTEEVHYLDVATAADRLIATDLEGCAAPPCLHDLHFSADGKKLLWASSKGNPLWVANIDGSAILRLPVTSGRIANSPNVITNDNRLFYMTDTGPYSIGLDGTSPTPLPYAFANNDLIVSADGRTAAWQTAYFGRFGFDYSIQTASTIANTIGFDSTPYSNLSLSADGTHIAFIHNRQAWTPQQITNFQLSDVLDLTLNAAGTKILYSTGQTTSNQRAAIWLANSDGTNPKTIFAPTYVNPNGVIGINSQGLPLALSPGSYFTIYGQNLYPKDEIVTANFPVSVATNKGKLPLQAVTPWQINAILPMDTPVGPLTLNITLADGTQLAASATVADSAPALITYTNPATGRQQAAAFHLSTLLPCDQQRPARADEIIETYGFGLGLTDPIQSVTVPTPYNPLPRTIAQPTVTIGTQNAQVLYSGLVPTVIGVYQINILIPKMPSGVYQMKWSTGNVTPASQGAISIQ